MICVIPSLELPYMELISVLDPHENFDDILRYMGCQKDEILTFKLGGKPEEAFLIRLQDPAYSFTLHELKEALKEYDNRDLNNVCEDIEEAICRGENICNMSTSLWKTLSIALQEDPGSEYKICWINVAGKFGLTDKIQEIWATASNMPTQSRTERLIELLNQRGKKIKHLEDAFLTLNSPESLNGSFNRVLEEFYKVLEKLSKMKVIHKSIYIFCFNFNSIKIFEV